MERKKVKDMYNKEKIVELISAVTQTGFGDFNLSLSSLGSIQFIKIIIAIEEKYGFEFEDDYLNYENLGTIEKIVKYMDEHNI